MGALYLKQFQKKRLRRILRRFSNIKFSIFIIFLSSVIFCFGTCLEQNKAVEFYTTRYPVMSNINHFLTWQTISFFHLNSVYESLFHRSMLLITCISLFSCSIWTQIPLLKKRRQWEFSTKRGNSSSKWYFSQNSPNSVLYNFHTKKSIFRQGKKNYGQDKILGLIGAICVHISLLILLFSITKQVIKNFSLEEGNLQGEIFHLNNVNIFNTNGKIKRDFIARLNTLWINSTNK